MRPPIEAAVDCKCRARRTFLRQTAACAAGIAAAAIGLPTAAGRQTDAQADPAKRLTLFLGGDLMSGRGIDQALPVSVDPRLYEPYLDDARDYIRLAEARNGPLSLPLDTAYVWGDALRALRRIAPAVRVVNLETAITAGGTPWPGKGIHYRMHPANTGLLTVAGIDACALANNHALDWGRVGLADTLRALDSAGIAHAGAGSDAAAAMAPAVIEVGKGTRVLLFALASPSSGVPRAWAAGRDRSGLHLVDESAPRAAERLSERIAAFRRRGDVVVVSIHWGDNWGYRVPREQVRFAHALVDGGTVDLVHGHSSHHPKAVEVYRDRLILYGCGDLINDYEGIRGREAFRGDLGLLFLPTLDAADGRLLALDLVAVQRHRLALRRALAEDTDWLLTMLNRESHRFGSAFQGAADGRLRLA